MTRHFRSLLDLEKEQLIELLDLADSLKRDRGTAEHPTPLLGKSVALIFEKASTRTRISFEVGVRELGGSPVVLMAQHTQMGRGEPLSDTARMLSGYVHGAMVRTFGQERIETLAEYATIPIINGLTDRYHPCQLLADLQTVRENMPIEGLTVAWIGDGNNMAHSWMLAAARLGFSLRVASPEGYEPEKEVIGLAAKLGADVTILRDPHEAASGANVVTTDVWASMGQEEEQAIRERAFRGFVVDDTLMLKADKDAIFLHCLPAHRGEEVSSSVLEGPQSRVWSEAENRLHAQKALMVHLIGA